MTTDKLKQLIHAYLQRFGEGPPIFSLDTRDAIRLMEAALERNSPLEADDVNQKDLPPSALL